MNFLLLLSLIALFLHHVNTVNSYIVTSAPVEASNRHLFKMLEVKGENKFDIEQVVAGLDKLHLDQYNVDLCGPILCVSANLTESTLYGLGSLQAIKSDFFSDGENVILDIDVNFPFLVLETEYYEMEGNIMQALPLAGHGKLHLETKQLRLWTKIILKTAEEGTSIEEFQNPGFSIQNIYSRTQFDGKIDGIMNAMMEELLPLFLNRFNRAIAVYSCALIKELLNPIL